MSGLEASAKIWRNGELIPWDDAQIHVCSHVVHYASAVFEGIRCYNTQSGPGVFRLDDQIKRLCQSAHIYRPMQITCGRARAGFRTDGSRGEPSDDPSLKACNYKNI